MKKIQNTIWMLLVLCMSHVHGQSFDQAPVGIGLSGGELASPGGMTLRSSVGEPMTEVWQISAYELRQGFQQTVQGAITSVEGEQLHTYFSTFPQPAGEELHIRWGGRQPMVVKLAWWDISGRRISGMDREVFSFLPGETVTIGLEHLIPGTYLLKATGEGGQQIAVWPVIRLP